MSSYDVIGDIHGHAEVLERMLRTLGYRERRGAYRHPARTAIFVGDLIDRGPDQLRTLQIARAMVEAGSAQLVLGNHEFNAVAWATPDDRGGWCRPHSEKNRRQHEVFLAAVGEDSPGHHEWIDWFTSQPLWFDADGLRVVHACWDESSMRALGGDHLTDEMVTATAGSPAYEAIEIVLKGPEIDLGARAYLDKEGTRREEARLAWWDPDATTLARAAVIPGEATTPTGDPFPPLPDDPIDTGFIRAPDNRSPVLYGHYWRSGPEPRIDNPRAACLDWSVANHGPLVAYRFSGESDLTDANLIAVR